MFIFLMVSVLHDQLFHEGGTYLFCISIDWFLHDRDFRHEKAKTSSKSEVVTQRGLIKKVLKHFTQFIREYLRWGRFS